MTDEETAILSDAENSAMLTKQMQAIGWEPIYLPDWSDDFLMWRNADGKEIGIGDWDLIPEFIERERSKSLQNVCLNAKSQAAAVNEKAPVAAARLPDEQALL